MYYDHFQNLLECNVNFKLCLLFDKYGFFFSSYKIFGLAIILRREHKTTDQCWAWGFGWPWSHVPVVELITSLLILQAFLLWRRESLMNFRAYFLGRMTMREYPHYFLKETDWRFWNCPQTSTMACSGQVSSFHGFLLRVCALKNVKVLVRRNGE